VTSIVGRTNPGARGGQNQDSMGWDAERQVALVADGMGGYAGGEVASALVKETILEAIGSVDLETAIMRAHAKILTAAEQNSQYTGMGSTVVALQVNAGICHVAWVGDSRGYLWRRGALKPLTRDHSVAEVLRDAEHLSETQLRAHPLRHRVIQSLGLDQPVPSASQTPLRQGDWLMLCSDGLSGELRDEEIVDVLRANGTPDAAADALVNQALAKGGHDNVTVVLMQYTGRTRFDWGGLLRSERAVIWLAALGGILMAVAVGFVALWLKRK
jgi:serine/threonine protein phosphatase PrpC